jgi:hypothetical protein
VNRVLTIIVQALKNDLLSCSLSFIGLPFDLQVLLQAITTVLMKCKMLKICTLLFVYFGVDENNANDGSNMAKTNYKWKCCLNTFIFSLFLNCVCCEIFVQCVGFWNECLRLMSSVLFVFSMIFID